MKKLNTPKNWAILFASITAILWLFLFVKEWGLESHSIAFYFASLDFSVWLAASLIIEHLEEK